MIFGCYERTRPHIGRIVRVPSDDRTRSRLYDRFDDRFTEPKTAWSLSTRLVASEESPKRKKPGRFDQASRCYR